MRLGGDTTSISICAVNDFSNGSPSSSSILALMMGLAHCPQSKLRHHAMHQLSHCCSQQLRHRRRLINVITKWPSKPIKRRSPFSARRTRRSWNDSKFPASLCIHQFHSPLACLLLSCSFPPADCDFIAISVPQWNSFALLLLLSFIIDSRIYRFMVGPFRCWKLMKFFCSLLLLLLREKCNRNFLIIKAGGVEIELQIVQVQLN